jgi:hypothetical protein
VRRKVLRPEHDPDRLPKVWCALQDRRDKDRPALKSAGGSAAARSCTSKEGATSPEPKDILIEELDEEDTDVSEIIAGKDEESQQDTR